MQDKEMRGLVLQRLYDIRHTKDKAGPHDFDDLHLRLDVLCNILKQLVQEGSVNWKPVRSGMGMGYETFIANITVHGSKVIEGIEQSKLEIKIDRSINIHATNMHIGDINIDAEKIAANINSASATVTEKEEAKSLLRKLMDNPILKGALEMWVKSRTGGS